MKRLKSAYAKYRPRISVYSGRFHDPVYDLGGHCLGIQFLSVEPAWHAFLAMSCPCTAITIFSQN